jgi:hypothetical protein
MHRTLVGLAVLPLLHGCTAGLATLRMVEAGRKVQEAYDANADARAPFEYQMAVRALDKANEENAESEFKSAMQLAKTASTWAADAKLVAEGGSRRIEGSSEGLPEGADPLGETERNAEPADPGKKKPTVDDGIDDEELFGPEPKKPEPEDDEGDDDFLRPEDDDELFRAPLGEERP